MSVAAFKCFWDHLEMCIYLPMCTCVLHSESFPSVFVHFSLSLCVLMQLFRINTAFKLLELLSFKGIFMRRKKSLSLIWFKYFQRNQTAKSSLEMLSHFWTGRKLSRQNAAAAAAAAARCTRGWLTRSTFSHHSSPYVLCLCSRYTCLDLRFSLSALSKSYSDTSTDGLLVM